MPLSNLTIYSVWLETICLCVSIPFIKDRKIIGFSGFLKHLWFPKIVYMTGYLLYWFYFFCYYKRAWPKATQGRKGLCQLTDTGYSPVSGSQGSGDLKQLVTSRAQPRAERDECVPAY